MHLPHLRLSLVIVFLLAVAACGERSDLMAPDPAANASVSSATSGTLAYVTNHHSHDVSVIDVSTHTVIETIALPGFLPFPRGVAISPDRSEVYVTSHPGRLFVIETGTNAVTHTIPLNGSDVHDVAVSPDGTRAWATQRNDGSIAVIDLVARAQIGTITVGAVSPSLPFGSLPTRLALSPDGTTLFVANFMTHEVAVIETATNTVVATIPVGVFPNDVEVSGDGSRVYAANWGSKSVTVIDADARTVVDTWHPGTNVWQLDLSSDGSSVFVGNWGSSGTGLTVLDAATGATLADHAVPVQQTGIEATPDDAFVYMTDFSGGSGLGNSVAVLDLTAGAVAHTVTVGTAPFDIAIASFSNDPETIQDCMNGGWQDYGFANQGLCIRFVNTGKDSR